MIVNWVRVEARVRGILSGYYRKQFSVGVELSDAANALEQISLVFGLETERGYEHEDAERNSE